MLSSGGYAVSGPIGKLCFPSHCRVVLLRMMGMSASNTWFDDFYDVEPEAQRSSQLQCIFKNRANYACY